MMRTSSSPVKPYTITELAALYGMSIKTVKTWLKPPHRSHWGEAWALFYHTAGEDHL